MASRKQAARRLASRRLHAGVGKSASRATAAARTVRRTRRIPSGPTARQVAAGNLRNMAFRQRGNASLAKMSASRLAARTSGRRMRAGVALGGLGAVGVGAWVNNSGRASDAAIGRQTGVYGF